MDLRDDIKEPHNKHNLYDKHDLYDTLADLTTQSYFVAKELDADRAVTIWKELAHAVVDTCDFEGYQDSDECPFQAANHAAV